MSRDKRFDVNDPYGPGKSGPGKIHEVILVTKKRLILVRL